MSTLLIGKYQATIYPEGNGHVGAISLGFDGKGNRKRIKRRGRTKAAVTDKLKKAVEALETGIDANGSYTVAEAVNDWLAKGLKGRDDDTIATQPHPGRAARDTAHRRDQAPGTACRPSRRVARRAD